MEVNAEKEKTFMKIMKGTSMARIGKTIANPVLRIASLDGSLLMEEGLRELKAAWQAPLPAMLDGRKK